MPKSGVYRLEQNTVAKKKKKKKKKKGAMAAALERLRTKSKKAIEKATGY